MFSYCTLQCSYIKLNKRQNCLITIIGQKLQCWYRQTSEINLLQTAVDMTDPFLIVVDETQRASTNGRKKIDFSFF